MNTATLAAPVPPAFASLGAPNRTPWAAGVAVGLLAASIGALYTVMARWGLAQGLLPADLTAMRFGVAGLVMAPLLIRAWLRDARQFTARPGLWLALCALAGTPFAMLMFGALQWAPASHAAVFPFAAMSVMGILLGAWVQREALSARRLGGLAVVMLGLVLVSGLRAHSLHGAALKGDLLFIAAGTLWAGFGVLLRRHGIAPLLATAVVSVSALLTYLPFYLMTVDTPHLLQVPASVWGVELLVQGLVAGVGTLYTFGKLVALLGPARAAVFPALAPGLAALIAWPVLGHVPQPLEALGLAVTVAGLLLALSQPKRT